MGDLAAVLPETSCTDILHLEGLDESVYRELMSLARSHLGRSGTMSLDAPSLVHETYLRFSKQGAIQTAQRKIFFAYASRVMRAVIVDYVRERSAQKRGGGEGPITLTTGVAGAIFSSDSFGQLEEALRSLEEIDPRSHVVVEMRYFGGMTELEIAELLGVSVPTVKRDWRKARAFLFEAIGDVP